MAIQTDAYLCSRFVTGAIPTQQDFFDLLDSRAGIYEGFDQNCDVRFKTQQTFANVCYCPRGEGSIDFSTCRSANTHVAQGAFSNMIGAHQSGIDSTSCRSSIFGGESACIRLGSCLSNVFGGDAAFISNSSQSTVIGIGGLISDSNGSFVAGNGVIDGSSGSTVLSVGNSLGEICSSPCSSLISSRSSSIICAPCSSIISSMSSTICYGGDFDNECVSCRDTIVGGISVSVCGSQMVGSLFDYSANICCCTCNSVSILNNTVNLEAAHNVVAIGNKQITVRSSGPLNCYTVLIGNYCSDNTVANGSVQIGDVCTSMWCANKVVSIGSCASSICGGSEMSGLYNGNLSTICASSNTLVFGRGCANDSNGSVVFGGRTGVSISSVNDIFVAKFVNGYCLFTDSLGTSGVCVGAGGSSWASISDKTKKENYEQIDHNDILERIARMPVEKWQYISEKTKSKHIGPYAQDFKTLFGLGDSDTTISTIDADGVLFSGIKGLYNRVKSLEICVDELSSSIKQLQNE